jgi:AraC-like DNA-binding protein
MSEVHILYVGRYFGHLNEHEHEHDFFQIFLPASDKVYVQSAGKPCRCNPEDSFFFVAPGVPHTLLLQEGEMLTPGTFHCALDCKFTVADPILAEKLSGLPLIMRRPPLCQQLAEWIVRTAAARGEHSQELMESLLQTMLLFLLDEPGALPDTELLYVPDTTVRFGSVNITMLTEFIDEHYAEKITLERLTHLACMNKTSLCHAFRCVIGMSPIAYVNFRRMEVARRLLLESKMSISEIASRVGYHNVNHFCRNFKEKEGLAPSSYRNHNLRTLNTCRGEILHRDIYDRELSNAAVNVGNVPFEELRYPDN